MAAHRKLFSTVLASLRYSHRLTHLIAVTSRVPSRSYNPAITPSLSSVSCHGIHFQFSSYSTASDGGGACWNCGATGVGPGPFLSCGACGSVQPMDTEIDYFQIFGLERRYDIPDENLGGKYKDWQKKLHPDLVQSKSEKEKAFAAEQSSRVIDAYRTLSKPLSRALYLLQLKGIHVDEEKTVGDPELLAEMMDIREAVDEADDSQALKKIGIQIQKKFEAAATSFQEAIEKEDFDYATTSSDRMRYYHRAIEAVEKKLSVS